MKFKWIIPIVLVGALTLDWEKERAFEITSAYAQANGQLTISWTPPTEYTDGAALLEQDLDFYTFYCDGAPLATIDSIIGTYTATVSTNSLSTGDHVCTLRVTTLEAVESGDSNAINFTIGPRVPMAPAGLTST
jgi:ABC-type sugar transport system substrate-binding protein